MNTRTVVIEGTRQVSGSGNTIRSEECDTEIACLSGSIVKRIWLLRA
jgi:hypothetical protein